MIHRTGSITTCVALLMLATGFSAFAAGPVSVASPNGKLMVEIQSDDAGQLVWSVKRQDQTVLDPAPVGLTVDGKDLGKNPTFGAPSNKTIIEKYPVNGVHAVAINRCNESIIPVTAGGVKYHLDVRVFDDGAAVRTRIALAGDHNIASEATSFALPAGAQAWWSRYDYEQPYSSGTVDRIPAGENLSPPVTIKSGDLYLSFTEANNATFPDMGLVKSGNFLKAVFPASAGGWPHKGAIVTPWRVAIVAENLTQLVNTDMVTNLCPPPSAKLANAGWIKPGRVLWQWWAIGAPQLHDQKQWVDAAKTLGFEYYLIDDGWRNWKAEGKDQWQLLKEVIDYGKAQGVKSIVWVDSKEMRTDASRRAYLEKVATLGAAGIKIDFIPPPTAEIMRWYEGALKDTAELSLLCNFHGAVKPSGRIRTWPHELTREAVRGHEYHMTRYGRVQAAEHDTIVQFTRYLAGNADFTPTAFDPREMVGYTWPHLLAQSVHFTSPLMCLAGKYQDFIGNPAEDFLRHLPATWDETIVLPGSEIGKTVIMARRKGNQWFIGALNGAAPVKTDVDLPFLGNGQWKAEVFGENPENAASFKRETKNVTPKDKMTFEMPARGGWAIWFTKNR